MATQFPRPQSNPQNKPRAASGQTMSWAGYAAAGSLLAGGVLLLTGQRRAGMITAASGAALALLDQKEVISAWWNVLPVYLNEAQDVLGKVQNAIEEVSVQRQKIHRILAR